MADDRVEIEIVLDDGSVQKGFAKVKKEGEKTGSFLASSFTKVGAAVAGIGATLAAAFAGKKVLAAAAQQEAAVKELNTSLKLAGSFSQEASQQFQEFASSLQQTTRFGDEVILQQTALARNFARSNEETEKLVSAAIDLSEATGITLDSAIRNLGKTFGGLTGELGESVPALRNLTAEQLKAGAALDFVADRFGGAAAANVQTYAGRLEQLSNVFGDLLEEIGFIVTKSPVLNVVFGKIVESVTGAIDAVKGFRGTGDVFGELLLKLVKFAEGVNLFVIAPIELVINGIKIAFQGLKTGLQAFVGTFAGIASQIAGFFSPDSEIAQSLKTFKESADETFLTFADETSGAIDNVFNFERSAQIAEFTESLRTSVEGALDTTRNLASEGAANLDKFAGKAGETSKKVKKEFDLKTGIGAGISKSIQATVQAVAAGENAFAAFAKSVLGVFGDLAIQLGQFFIIEGIAVEALKSLGGAAAIAAGAALIALGTLIKGASGGAGGVSAGGAGSGAAGGDAGAIGGVGLVNDEVDEAEDTEIRDRTKVALTVQGDVLDSRETGLRIVDILNESFESEGTVLA